MAWPEIDCVNIICINLYREALCSQSAMAYMNIYHTM